MSILGRLANRKVLLAILWTLHVLLVVAITLGLWALGRRYRLDSALLSPLPTLHPIWLPLLFLLLYTAGWLAWWFVRLLTDPAEGEYPDVLDAWNEGLSALSAAGIDPTVTPVFLVVGKPATGPADFFAATGLPLAVRGEPRRPDAPVRIYADRKAIYVVAERASVVSRLAELQPGHVAVQTAPVAAPAPPAQQVDATSLLDAFGVNVAPYTQVPVPGALSSYLHRANVVASATGQPTLNATDWLPQPGTTGTPELTGDEIERESARLRYLCRLIAARRRPLCSANGVLWLLPLGVSASGPAADRAAAMCRADLAAIEAGLRVDCPMTVVVVDAQAMPGFRLMTTGLPGGIARDRLFGRTFPLVPNLPADRRYEMVHEGLDWLARHLAPALLYQRFGSGVEPEDGAQLWRLAGDLYDRREPLARLVSQGLLGRPQRPPMLSGIYFAATGPDERDRAFATGSLRELISNQNFVKWTESALAHEADTRRMAALGYLAASILVISLIAFGVWSWNE